MACQGYAHNRTVANSGGDLHKNDGRDEEEGGDCRETFNSLILTEIFSVRKAWVGIMTSLDWEGSDDCGTTKAELSWILRMGVSDRSKGWKEVWEREEVKRTCVWHFIERSLHRMLAFSSSSAAVSLSSPDWQGYLAAH